MAWIGEEKQYEKHAENVEKERKKKERDEKDEVDNARCLLDGVTGRFAKVCTKTFEVFGKVEVIPKMGVEIVSVIKGKKKKFFIPRSQITSTVYRNDV